MKPTDKPTSELLRTWCEITLALVERHGLSSVGPPMSGLAERLVAEMGRGQMAHLDSTTGMSKLAHFGYR